MELYPELAEYIFLYCRDYFNAAEIRAMELYGRFGTDHTASSMSIRDEHSVNILMENDFEYFRQATVQRIFHDHFEKLPLNLCPACRKIARTPQARQCRFCGHDWH